jgi:type IV pilus assembly protein PilQ
MAQQAWKYGIVGMLGVVALAGCAGLINVSNEAPPAAIIPAFDTTQSASVPSSFALSEELAFESASHLGVQFERTTAPSERVLLGSGVKEGSYKLFTLKSPDRLIVDIAGAKQSKATKEYALNQSSALRSLRVGAHPGATRVVIDLKDPSAQYESSIESGKLILTFKSETIALAARQSSPSDAMIARVIGESNDTSSAKSLSDDVVALSGLSLERGLGDQNLLVAELSAPSAFTFKRTSPNEYSLKLPAVMPSSQVQKQLLGASSKSAIRSAKLTMEEGATIVKIATTPTTVLSANSDGDRIIVAQSRPQLPDGALAQPKDEAISEAVKSSADSTEEVKAEGKGPASPAGSPTDEAVASLLEEQPKYSGRLISLDLQDTDIDNALRIIAEVSNLNIIASEDVSGKITLRLNDVPWDQALDVILKTNGLDKVQEGNVVRIAPVDKLRAERESLKQAIVAEQELEPLTVEYIRVSYARAGELKPLVESVLSERGSVTYDERTNQLIVKDVRNGIKNVAKLVSKLDLRTPQILLETQIVEAEKNFLRDLGSELDFDIVRSPATGNATGYNFPNSIRIGGGGTNMGGNASSFPAGIGQSAGSALSMIFGSADGTRSLTTLLSALEQRGVAKIISRPSVSTTNNKQATIKSVTKIRIKLPSGGLSVATGQGAAANGGGGAATESVEAGIVLEVTPQASPDYYVLLDINAKSSSLGSVAGGADGIPPETERSATSTVLVSSGQTFAMGGIYKITENDDESGVPFLKDVPVLGTFFRRITTTAKDEELMFFITPRIIEGSFDDGAMSAAGAGA